jgi:hypothetical protein
MIEDLSLSTEFRTKMTSERRRSERFSVGFYFHQIIDDEPQRCFTTDLSAIGLFAEQPVAPFERNSNIVQIELPLPNTSDSIWAKAEVVYDQFGSLFHGSGIRFVAMARQHQRMLREWLRDSQWRPTNRAYWWPTERVLVVRPS